MGVIMSIKLILIYKVKLKLGEPLPTGRQVSASVSWWLRTG